jgi:hypothetical protein
MQCVLCHKVCLYAKSETLINTYCIVVLYLQTLKLCMTSVLNCCSLCICYMIYEDNTILCVYKMYTIFMEDNTTLVVVYTRYHHTSVDSLFTNTMSTNSNLEHSHFIISINSRKAVSSHYGFQYTWLLYVILKLRHISKF